MSRMFWMLHSWGTLGLDWHRLVGFVRAQYDMHCTNGSHQFWIGFKCCLPPFRGLDLKRLFALNISFVITFLGLFPEVSRMWTWSILTRIHLIVFFYPTSRSKEQLLTVHLNFILQVFGINRGSLIKFLSQPLFFELATPLPSILNVLLCSMACFALQ